MRGIPALRLIVVAAVAVGVAVSASAAVAAPSAGPQPTPPPGGGGGGSSSGGGGGGGGGGGSSTVTRRPTGPVAVGNGKAGAVMLEATGERTQEPTDTAAAAPATTTEQPPATTAEAPATTAEAPVATTAPATTAEAPVATAETPAPTPAAPAGAATSSDDEGLVPSLPADGLAVLVGVLLIGLGVGVRALRARERKIGFALLGFCAVYLVALGGVMTGVAGAATAEPGAFAATAGDGEVLLTFDAPPPGRTLVVRRAVGAAPPAGCALGTPVPISATARGSQVDGDLANGTAYAYRACLTDGTVTSPGVIRSARPEAGVDASAPRPVSSLIARISGGRVVVTWRNPTDRDYAATRVVRKFGSAPESPTDGTVVYRGDLRAAFDYPFSSRAVHYAVFASDEDGNVSGAARTSLPRFDPPLRTPRDRSTISATRPRFSWKAVPGADHYNVLVYFSNRCCNPRTAQVNAVPTGTSLVSPRPLLRTSYTWYVLAHMRPGNAAASYDAVNRVGWKFTVR